MTKAQIYSLQFEEILQAVFQKRSYFADFTVNQTTEVRDGISNADPAFVLKTSNIPVVVGTSYNKGANVGFGTGTSNTTRFGPRTEIVYTNTNVPYTGEWSIHEGIDRFTVNANFDEAIADRLEMQAVAKTQVFDNAVRDFLSTNAAKSAALADTTAAAITGLFNELAAYYANNEVIGTLHAKVVPAVYNAILDNPLVTADKRSSVDIDKNTVLMFKGFVIDQIPESKVKTGELGYIYPEGFGKVFAGIDTMRTIESEDFNGVALQGAGKYGVYTLPANHVAIAKITGTLA